MQYVMSAGTVKISGSFSVGIISSSNIFFFLMGYFFEHVLDKKYYTLRNAVILNISGIVAIAVSCMATHYRAELTGVCTEELSQEFHGSLISIPAFAVYFTVKYLFIRKPVSGNAQIILRFAGSNVFGIYLSEGLLRKLTLPVYNFNCKYIGSLPACILWVLAVFICGCFLTALLKKIPFVGRFL